MSRPPCARCSTNAGCGRTERGSAPPRVGDQLLDRFADGSWLVELASVTSGDSVVELAGVEEGSGATTHEIHEMTLGSSVLVQLVMGPDGISSLGFTVTVDCEAEPSTAAVVPASTEESTTETTSAMTALAKCHQCGWRSSATVS